MVSLTGHGHVRSRRTSTATNSNRSSVDEGNMTGADDDTTTVDAEQGNVLSHIISQLRPGADLSRVTLPTFILEPRSMLERITNFMAHPETLLPTSTIDDPTERFLSVVKFYLSGWHIRPPGVKKPLNPILGETYTCYWEYPDHTKGYYIAEQTSHHPPKSSYFFMAPEHNIRIDGTLKPRSKFLGNSAASMMEGIAVLRLLNRGKPGNPEKYFLTQPNIYARGILFGKMKYELGDHCIVECPELDLISDVEFKTKGYFTGTYNAIGGTVKRISTGEILYEISGMWTGEMYVKDALAGKKTLLYDAKATKPTPPSVRPFEEQGDRESQKLWLKTVQAVIAKDHVTATDEKSAIEDRQRQEQARRVADGVDWHPRYFRAVRGGPGGPEEGEEKLDWILSTEITGSAPEEQTKQILAIAPIVRNQDFRERMPIPQSRQSREYSESIRSGKGGHSEDASSMSNSQPMNSIPQANEDDMINCRQDETPRAAPAQAQVPGQQNMSPTQKPMVSSQREAPVEARIPSHPFMPASAAVSYHEAVPVQAKAEQPQVQAAAKTQTPVQQPIQQPVEKETPVNQYIDIQQPLTSISNAPTSRDTTPRGSEYDNMHSHLPDDLRAAQTENGGAAQREVENLLAETSDTPKLRASALQDFQNEMRKHLPGNDLAEAGVGGKPQLNREESGDSSEFVDAKSTL